MYVTNIPNVQEIFWKVPLYKHILNVVQSCKTWKFIRMNIHLKIHIPRSAQGMVYLPSFGYLLKDFPTQRLDLRPTSVMAWASSLEKQAPQKFGRTPSQRKTIKLLIFIDVSIGTYQFCWDLFGYYNFLQGKKQGFQLLEGFFFHLKFVSPKKISAHHLHPGFFGSV